MSSDESKTTAVPAAVPAAAAAEESIAPSTAKFTAFGAVAAAGSAFAVPAFAAAATSAQAGAAEASAAASAGDDHDEDKADEREPDVAFEPVTRLEKINMPRLEDEEDTLTKIRARVFRFDKSAQEWKERGVGTLKFMMHKESKKVRILMHRDQTLKCCLNHYVSSEMKLRKHLESDRAFCWDSLQDYSENVSEALVLAIRFRTPEIAAQFETRFNEAREWNVHLKNNKKEPESNADAENEKAPACPTPDAELLAALNAAPPHGSNAAAADKALDEAADKVATLKIEDGDKKAAE